MDFNNYEQVHDLDGYRVKEEIAKRSDKAIYLVESKESELYYLKVFQKTYKYSLYKSLHYYSLDLLIFKHKTRRVKHVLSTMRGEDTRK